MRFHKRVLTFILLTSTFLSMLHLQNTTQSVVQANCDSCLINQAPPITEPSTDVQNAWILLAGDTSDHRDMASIQNAVNIIYEVLRGAGFTSEQLYYLGPEVGPSQPYVNTSATKINLQYAIETWAPQHVDSTQSLGIAIISHGAINALAVMVGDVLRDYHLDSYLDAFEAATGSKRIIVVIEGCHSGSFIDELSQDNRIIVTSTATYFGAAFNADRTNGAFSESFWSSIAFCATIGHAFEEAVEHIRDLGCNQSPQLDDNHDGIGTTPYHNDFLPTGGEGFDALNVHIWPRPRVCQPKIQIKMIPLPMYAIWDSFTSVANIGVEVESSTGISKVIARFVPSGWEPNDPLDGYMYPINDASIKTVELEDPLMNGIYSGDGS